MKKSISFFTALFLLLCLTTTDNLFGQTWGANDERLMPLSHNQVTGMFVENPFTHAIIEDDVLYFADYRGFNVYDVSNPSSPVLKGSTPVPGKTTHFAIAGNRAYVCNDFGIAIINISIPESPEVINVEYFDYKPHKIMVDGTHAFVAGNNGVRSYSLSNPDGLEFLDYLFIQPSNFLSAGIEKYGDYIYFVNQSNLYVVNAANPSNMVMGMNISLSPGGSCWGNLAIKDNLLLVVSTQRLRIFNLDNPASPAVIYSDIPSSHSMYDLVVEDNWVVVNHNSNQRWTIVDISDSANPVSLYMSTEPIMNGLYSLGTLKDDILYILDNGHENFEGSTVHLIDISTPTSPTYVSNIQSGVGKTKASAMIKKDGNKYALVTKNNTLGSGIATGELAILDVTNPTQPTVVSTLELPNYAISITAGSSDYAFALQANYVWPNYSYQVVSVNIQNINNPFIMDIQPSGVSIAPVYHNSIHYHIGRVYVASQGTLHIFSESNGQLSPLGSTSIYGQTGTGVFTDNPDYVYVTAASNGFQLYNVTDPTNPFMVNFYNTAGSSWDVYVSDGIAYVADYSEGLATFDISQNIIQPITQIGFDGNLVSVRVYNDIAYMGTNDGRIAMFDVSDPAQPFEIGWYLTPGSSVNNLKLDYEDHTLHVANELEMGIYQLETPTGLSSGVKVSAQNNLYPNPANSTVNFTLDVPQNSPVSIFVYDMMGRLVETVIDKNLDKGSRQISWNTGKLQPGIYITQINVGNQRSTEKLIIQR